MVHPKLISPAVRTGIHRISRFGSSAYGHLDKHSDLDLIIVTDGECFPKDYREKSDIYLKVSESLSDIAGKMLIDLIVYTKSMYSRFVQLGSLFSKEILDGFTLDIFNILY